MSMRDATPDEIIQASAMAESVCKDMAEQIDKWVSRIADAQQSGACPQCDPAVLILAGAVTFTVAVAKHHSVKSREELADMISRQWDSTKGH